MQRKLGRNVEQLEGRRLLTVAAEFVDGDLMIDGVADGPVAIVATGEQTFDVVDDGQVVQSFEGAVDDIRIDLREDSTANNDVAIQLDGMDVDRIVAHLGNGDNSLSLESGTTTGSVQYFGGDGSDDIEMASDFTVGRSLSAFLRDGDNTLDLNGTVDRSLRVQAGDGDDLFLLGEDSVVGRRATIRAGGGDNTAELAGSIEGALQYRGGAGDDLVEVLATGVVEGRTNMRLGHGDNHVVMEGVLASGLNIAAGDGDDLVELLGSGEVGGNTRMRLGTGDDLFMQEGEMDGRLRMDQPAEHVLVPAPEVAPGEDSADAPESPVDPETPETPSENDEVEDETPVDPPVETPVGETEDEADSGDEAEEGSEEDHDCDMREQIMALLEGLQLQLEGTASIVMPETLPGMEG